MAMIYTVAIRGSSFTGTSEVRCLTNSWGAEKNGEWLVSIDMTFWHGRAVYIFLCRDGETPLSRSVSIYTRGIRPKCASVMCMGVATGALGSGVKRAAANATS